jgi:CheY-like chemotaxis protein
MGSEQAERLQSLGTLAAGLAHEFNNLLAVILGHSDLLRRGIERNVVDVDHLSEISNAVRRGSALCKGLLAFGRKGIANGSSEFMDVRETVEDIGRLLKPILGAQCELAVELGCEPAQTRVNRDLLTQSVINLILNARDALSGRGRIVVQVEANLTTDRRTVEIRVIDEGVGIDPALQRKVFEPFYTTKPVGQGTGLGLAIAHEFAIASGGTISVRSKLGQGSTFTISLPFAEISEGANGCARSDFRGLRAIVVDDEPALVSAHKLMLEALGFEVTAFDNASAMLAAIDADAEHFDLLVTDVMMPVLDGIRGAALARALRPELKVLFVTGRPERVDLSALPSGHGILLKPFAQADLVRALSDLLLDQRKAA